MEDSDIRKFGIMSDIIFDKTLYWLQRLMDMGTQKEVNVNGNGEATLDSKLCERIKQVKEIVGDNQVAFCTNGLTMTPMLALSLKDSGIDRVDVSAHSAYDARKAIDIMVDAGLTRGVLATGAMTSPHNWAGQLPKEDSVTVRLKVDCNPLIEGRGYVQSDGSVTPCCYDYRSLGAFGDVEEMDLLDREMKPFKLCEGCHQVIPKGMFDA